jgi:phage shock protein PspC (stress-responsive transcriptional regulator)
MYPSATLFWRKIPGFSRSHLLLIAAWLDIWKPCGQPGTYGTFGMEAASLHFVTRQEKTMQSETFFDSIKKNLNGETGQPIVLGVCKTLAARFNQEVWLIRLAAIVLGVFYSFVTLVVYVLLGLVMQETSSRSKSLFEGLGIWFRELTDKAGKCCNDMFSNNNSSHRDY